MKSSNAKIAEVVFGLPLEGPFDYSISDGFQKSIQIGQRVKVLFNRRRCIGYVVGFKSKSEFKKLNPILNIMDEGVCINTHLIELAMDFKTYYGCSLGEALEIMVPGPMRRGKSVKHPKVDKVSPKKESKTELIHDYGQTNRFDVLFSRINDALTKKQSVIFCVPENFYIKQIHAKLKEEFPEANIFAPVKSGGAVKDVDDWLELKTGNVDIVVGTRHVIFSPLVNLGLIVVYEEENTAFKQEQSPHYHVREVSQMRANIEKCDVTLVSTSPSAETWHMTKQKKWDLIKCKVDHIAKAQLVDMNNYNPRKSSIISPPLQNFIKQTHAEGKQTIILLTQRDFTPWVDEKKGTQYPARADRIMDELMRFYPESNVARFENTSKTINTNADFIIATQAIHKHQAKLRPSLIGAINVDALLSYFDYRTGHKTFSYLMHLRQFAREKLVIQTRMADNYCLKAVVKASFNLFYREELKLRKELGFPPFKHLIAMTIRGKKEENVLGQCEELYTLLEKKAPKAVEVSNLYSSGSQKLPSTSRYTIMLKAKSVQTMHKLINQVLPKVKRRTGNILTVNVDP